MMAPGNMASRISLALAILWQMVSIGQAHKDLMPFAVHQYELKNLGDDMPSMVEFDYICNEDTTITWTIGYHPIIAVPLKSEWDFETWTHRTGSLCHSVLYTPVMLSGPQALASTYGFIFLTLTAGNVKEYERAFKTDINQTLLDFRNGPNRNGNFFQLVKPPQMLSFPPPRVSYSHGDTLKHTWKFTGSSEFFLVRSLLPCEENSILTTQFQRLYQEGMEDMSSEENPPIPPHVTITKNTEKTHEGKNIITMELTIDTSKDELKTALIVLIMKSPLGGYIEIETLFENSVTGRIFPPGSVSLSASTKNSYKAGDIGLYPGDEEFLQCRAFADDIDKLEILKNGVKVENAGNNSVITLSSEANNEGVMYTIPYATADDAGQYTCRLTSKTGVWQKHISMEYIPQPAEITSFEITSWTADSLELSCSAVGDPMPHLKFYIMEDYDWESRQAIQPGPDYESTMATGQGGPVTGELKVNKPAKELASKSFICEVSIRQGEVTDSRTRYLSEECCSWKLTVCPYSCY